MTVSVSQIYSWSQVHSQEVEAEADYQCHLHAALLFLHCRHLMEGEGVLGQVDPGQVIQGQVGALAGRGLGGAEDHGNC